MQDTTEKKVSNQTLAPLKSENDKVKEELEVKDGKIHNNLITSKQMFNNYAEKPKEKSQEDGKKKKQAPFLQREVKVTLKVYLIENILIKQLKEFNNFIYFKRNKISQIFASKRLRTLIRLMKDNY